MSKVRIQVITVESDSADPEVWRSIRRLIRRAMMGGAGVAVVSAAPEKPRAKPEPPATPRACSTPDCIFDQGHRGECFQRTGAARTAATPPAPTEPLPVAREPKPAAPAPAAPPARRTEDDIRDIVQAQSAPPVTAPAGAPPMLEDRFLAAITRSPGVTADNLVMAVMGKADRDTRRRADMVLGNLQAAGKIMRANGQLFPQGYRGGVAAPPPKQTKRPVYPGTSDEETKTRAYAQILKAFTADNFYPIPKLAEECFGEATGSTVRKVKLMLHQLVANEKLERLAEGEFRPFTKKRELAEGDETESNGQPDEDDEEELDLGVG